MLWVTQVSKCLNQHSCRTSRDCRNCREFPTSWHPVALMDYRHQCAWPEANVRHIKTLTVVMSFTTSPQTLTRDPVFTDSVHHTPRTQWYSHSCLFFLLRLGSHQATMQGYKFHVTLLLFHPMIFPVLLITGPRGMLTIGDHQVHHGLRVYNFG